MTAFLIVLSLLFAWSLTSHRLVRWSVTASLAFIVAGVVLTRGSDPYVPIALDAHGFKLGVELVLAVVLFLDATEAKDYGRVGQTAGQWRLLGLALPASVVLATLMGALLFPDTSWWLLAVTALVVMPADFSPIASVLSDTRIPLRVRAALNIEGGLNDGLISPIFVFCVANLVSAEGSTVGSLVWNTAKQAGLALALGGGLGLAAAWLVRRALATGWAGPGSVRLASLALPFLAYAATVLVDGNGFVASFVAGLCYAPTARALGGTGLDLVHDVGQVMGFAVWFILGALTADNLTAEISWAVVGYGLLALTVARFVPVVLALGGLGLTWPERAAMGWLGSRGVTSIVFAVLAATQIPEGQATFVVNAMCVTVMLSVILHSLTVGPIAHWFERQTPRAGDQPAASYRGRPEGR